MSVSPVVALRKAIRAYLLADAGFVAALGTKLYDEAPRGAEPPYALFGETQLRDWSADLSPGAEQLFTISVTSTMRGLSEALELAQRIADLLDEAALNLQHHRLVDLRFLSMETRREQNGRFARVNLRFRATTEYL
ncbi:MAG TPA: DUF3168 domain-containing protein [Methylocystis sp.]|jgi:hypothetical protein